MLSRLRICRSQTSCCAAGAGADGIKDLLPNSATSGSAREAVNERTSDLPSFSDVGDSLRNALGGNTSDPKDVGRAISQNTPGAHRLCLSPVWLRAIQRAGFASAMHVLLLGWCNNKGSVVQTRRT